MENFRFVHAADIHLDSPLRGLAGDPGRATARIRTATREAFDNLIGETIREEASFLVIAGDLYDGDWRDYQTGLFFVRQMGRLAEAEIPVFLLYGNHDAESQITKSLVLPENVKLFSSRKPDTFEMKHLGVVLHGQSYKQRDMADNLVPGYPEPVARMFNIGVLHTGLGGMGGHENYAPCSLDELKQKGYDYWALGHVHQGGVLHERPHVVFPGNLQGRHIRETGAKSACLVSVDDGEVAEVAPIGSDVVRWSLVTVDVGSCGGVPEVSDRIRNSLEEVVLKEGSGRLLACRMVLEGRTECHGRLLASTEHLLAEARASALGLGEETAWVEKVVVATEPALDPASLRAREDALGELRRIMDQAGEDESLLEQLRSNIGEILGKLPHEIRSDTEDAALRAVIDDDPAVLLGQVTDYLTARITGEGR